MSEDYAGNVADQALRAGILDDAQPSEPQISEPPAACSNEGGYTPPWKREDPPPDPYTSKIIHRMVADPHGVTMAHKLHEDGALGDEELEAVIELSPKPGEFVMQAADSEEALELLARYGESGVFNGQQIEAFVDAIGQRETRREMETAAKLAEEERLALEKADAEDREADRRNQLRDRIWDRYRTVREQAEASQ